ncbi:MAG TPA: T9SS type A sorting domain-containing protein [Flavobacterium sp.]|nr:T9SS type A sorting domain-containing protein [Flavobacterium sp.]
MKIKIQLIALLLFALPSTNAQVLFEENFDSYSSGHLNSDYTNSTPGQGGWVVSGYNASAIVASEISKGNVITIQGTSSATTGSVFFQQIGGVIDALWNNRTAGNNILKFEYEFYGASINHFNSGGGLTSQNTKLIDITFQSKLDRIGANYYNTTSNNHIVLLTPNFPYDVWIKVEMFIDYNTNYVYFYLPTFNIQKALSFSHNRIPEQINFGTSDLDQSSIVKLDNIKLSALQTLPSHLVSVSEFVSSKFNVFPNPVTDMVTITNSESIGIEQVEIFDISGKTIKSLSFNNENEVQLNLGDFASGMYLLHIKTNQGVAVKKVVKK